MALADEEEGWQAEMQLVFGNPQSVAGSDNDLFYLARRVAKSSARPLLYQCCGTEDFLYADNVKFKEFAQSLELDLTYEEGPGEHEWGTGTGRSKGCSIGCRCDSQHADFQVWIRRLPSLYVCKSV